MQYSVSALVVSLVGATLGIGLLALLLQARRGYSQFRTNLLWGLALFVFIRLALPVELFFTHTIADSHVMPLLNNVIRAQPAGSPWIVGRYLAVVWGLGTLVALGRYAWRYRQAAQAVAVAVAEAPGVYRSAAATSPFAFGIVAPRIIMPSFELAPAQQQVVLAHERQHLQNHDNLLKALVQLLVCAYWWWPPVHVFAKQAALLMELRVDEQVAQGEAAVKLAYLQQLLAVARKSTAPTTPMASAFSAVGESALARRVQFMVSGLQYRHTNPWLVALVCLLPLAATSVIVEPYAVNDPKLAGTYEADPASGYLLEKKDGTIHLVQDGHDLGVIHHIHQAPFNQYRIVKQR